MQMVVFYNHLHKLQPCLFLLKLHLQLQHQRILFKFDEM